MNSRGLTTVEFALVSVVLFLVLFASIEVARAMFVRAVLEEGARRAARLAVVSPADAATLSQLRAMACFGDAGECAVFAPGLEPGQIRIQYLDYAGSPVAAPTADPTAVRYVRVEVSAGGQDSYRLPLLAPFIDVEYPVGEIASIQPAQSLGVNPE